MSRDTYRDDFYEGDDDSEDLEDENLTDSELEEIYGNNPEIDKDGSKIYDDDSELEDDENSIGNKENKGKYDNSFQEVVRDEYNSFLASLADTYLKRVVEENKKPSTEVLIRIRKDINGYTEREEFRKLPYRLRNAYQKLNDLIENVITEESGNIVDHKEVLEGLIRLSDTCYNTADEIRFMGERNPCRITQTELYQRIIEVKEGLGETKLSKKASGMLDVCKHCPHKFNSD